ncbi:MAG: hypothetical protein PHW04_00850 [Candidatus Wallbacteria bacterium]|nr:hypothetical protein [Candidatus Wallbacteria bacterium]
MEHGIFYNETAGVWIGALLTLAIFSFLYKDNIVYRLAEYIFIGVANGYLLTITYFNQVKPNLVDKLAEHNWWYLIPGILGLMMVARLNKDFAWLSRWPMAYIVGLGSGLAITASVQTDIMAQIYDTLKPIMGGDFITNLQNLILIAGVLTSLFYFFFSVEHKGIYKNVSFVGICFLMIMLGGSFGNTVMARISLLIGRMQFLMERWLHVIS